MTANDQISLVESYRKFKLVCLNVMLHPASAIAIRWFLRREILTPIVPVSAPLVPWRSPT
jgi:hypothetical protein